MMHRTYNKHLCFLVYAAFVAIVFLSMRETVVNAQRVGGIERSLLDSGRFWEPQRDVPNILTGPTGPGSLDPTFGIGGKMTTDFGSSERAFGMAVQSDGKIVVAGTLVRFESASGTDFAVFRYNPDGSLDPSFDGDGKVRTSLGSAWDAAYSVAIQADGKIVAAGVHNDRAALVRYHTNGSVDTSFGAGGQVTAEYGPIINIAIQGDGKIVGVLGWTDFTLVRYLPDGSRDTSFGTDGFVTTDFGASYQRAQSVAIQTDGKIIAAGGTGPCDEKDCYLDFALTRYNTDGSPDTSFDGDGKLTTQFDDAYSVANKVILQPDGRFVVVGTAYHFIEFAVARYNSDGSLDASFDGDGRTTHRVGERGAYPTSATVQPDGKIIVGGNGHNGVTYDLSLVRFNADGSLDTSFDGDGEVATDFGGDDLVTGVAMQANGKIVAAGYSGDNPSYDFALAQYNSDGSLDTTFDGDGKVTTSFLNVSSVATAVVVGQNNTALIVGYANSGTHYEFAVAVPNGPKKLTGIGASNARANAAAIYPAASSSNLALVVGESNNGSNTDFALARYSFSHSNVLFDTGFGQNGKVTTDFGGNDIATAVAIYPDNWFVVAGTTYSSRSLALARYDPAGALDPAFGTGGKLIVPEIQNVTAIVIQPDGKIVVAGTSPRSEPFRNNFALARFHPNGALDTSFDGDGFVVTPFGFTAQINSLALQRNGRIVAGGFAGIVDAAVPEFALARYKTDGSLDTSFGVDGKVTTAFYYQGWVSAVRVQRNRKIVAVGTTFDDFLIQFALARYNPDGSLDTTFDDDGRQVTDFFGGDDEALSAAIQDNGRIIAAGSAERDQRTVFGAARYIGDSNGAPARFDYDGDGRTDYSVFRPSTGNWYVQNTSGGFVGMQFGVADDKLAPADYDGDGKTDIAVYRPSTGVWYVVNSSNMAVTGCAFGIAEDLPVPADYDGDGKADISVFRPSQGTWYRHNSADQSFAAIQFGQDGDVPTIGDFDSDDKSDIGIYRPATNDWYHTRSSDGSIFYERFGQAGDRIVPADYDDDGRTDIAIYRPASGFWAWRNSSNGTYSFRNNIGGPNDIPIPGDYDGDGKTDVGVWQPADGRWYILRSTNSQFINFPWGLNGDRPTPAAFGN